METMMLMTRLDALGYDVIRVLGSLVWQSTLLIVAGAVVAMLLRRKSSAVLAWVWIVVLCAIPLLPLFGVLAERAETPRAEIPVLPAYEQPQVTVAQSLVPPADAQVIPDRMPAGEFGMSDTPWAILFLAYLAGTGAMLALTATGWMRLSGWARNGRVLTDSRINGIIAAMRDRLGLARGVVAVEHPDTTVPLQLGVSRHVLLFPAGMSEALADDELGAVVTHELAHARRQDALVLATASLLRAVLWFHPLVWIATRRVAVLVERACDELVLAAGSDPVGYAEMLAGQALRLNRRFTPELAAGFMFSRHAFLARIEAILSHRSGGFARLSKLTLAGTAGALMVALVLSVSMPLGVVPTSVAPVLTGVTPMMTVNKSMAKEPIATATFRARCIDSITGDPVPGILLDIRSEGALSGTSGPNGMIEIPDTPADTVMVEVYTDTHSRWWSEQEYQRKIQASPSELKKMEQMIRQRSFNSLAFVVEDNMSPVTIIVEQSVIIRGTVVDPDGNPVSGASVTPTTGNSYGLSGDTRFDVLTNSRGRYEIRLPASDQFTYSLLAHDGAFREWRTWANGLTKPLSIPPGQVIEDVTIRLIRPVVVTGRVLDKRGKPIAGFEVIAHAADKRGNGYFDPRVEADQNGRFSLAHVRPGKHYIIAWDKHPPFIYMDKHPEALPKNMFRIVTLNAGETKTNIDLVGWGEQEIFRSMNEFTRRTGIH